MDFQSLSRKELQALCKKNKIPANITNVGMVDALVALQEVAGIEEFLNPIESESQQYKEKIENESPGNPRTACRTSTRKKPVKEEPQTTQSIVRTRRGRVGEMADQENRDLNIPPTPSFPSNRKRAPVPSARKKPEIQLIEENEQNNGAQERTDIETPSMPKTQRKVAGLGSTRKKTETPMENGSVQGMCSTRRSMRLLEKTMEKLSLMECGSIKPLLADKLFDDLPDSKGFCEQKISESKPEEMNMALSDTKSSVSAFDKEGDLKIDVQRKIAKDGFEEDESKEKLELGVAESDDPRAMNEEKDEEKEHNNGNDGMNFEGDESKEKVKMDVKENEEESQDRTQSEIIGESFNDEEKVEFDFDDLVDVDVIEAELLVASNQETRNFEKQMSSNVNVQDSISEPKMEELSKSENLVDIQVVDESLVESELVENSNQETCKQVNNFDSQDSIVEPLVEIQELPQEDNSGMIQNNHHHPDVKNDSSDEDEAKKNVSLRQLRKMIKQLQLTKKSNKEKTFGKKEEEVEKVVRTALQPLAENCMSGKDGQEKSTMLF